MMISCYCPPTDIKSVLNQPLGNMAVIGIDCFSSQNLIAGAQYADFHSPSFAGDETVIAKQIAVDRIGPLEWRVRVSPLLETGT